MLATKSVELDVRFVITPQVFIMHDLRGPYRSRYQTTYRKIYRKVIYHSQPIAKTSGDLIQSGGTHYKLFNLAQYPSEQNDLARSNPEPLNRMMSGLMATLETKNSQYPIDESGNEVQESEGNCF